jgi:sensor histidine kinase regulating citrate/malate metabolism
VTVTEAAQARRVTRATFWTRLFVLVVVVYMVATTATQTILALQDSERIRQNRAIQATIRDCVTPTGKCYRANQRQREQTVNDINRYSVLAAACAVVTPLDAPPAAREKAITTCIKDRLDADG